MYFVHPTAQHNEHEFPRQNTCNVTPDYYYYCRLSYGNNGKLYVNFHPMISVLCMDQKNHYFLLLSFIACFFLAFPLKSTCFFRNRFSMCLVSILFLCWRIWDPGSWVQEWLTCYHTSFVCNPSRMPHFKCYDAAWITCIG